MGPLHSDPDRGMRCVFLPCEVEARIEQDMRPQNSWDSLTDKPDDQASLGKCIQLWFWELMPMEPIL